MHNNPFPMLNFCLVAAFSRFPHLFDEIYLVSHGALSKIVRRAYIRLFLKQGRGKINQGKPLPLAQANLNNLTISNAIVSPQKDTECPSHIHELTINTFQCWPHHCTEGARSDYSSGSPTEPSKSRNNNFMSGWKARIGYLSPSVFETPSDWDYILPNGFTIVA